MSLRCRAGDLCRIIGAGPLRDRFITVTHLDAVIGPRGATWRYEGPKLGTIFFDINAFYDCVLQPIRGGDPDDESVLDVIREASCN